MREKFKNGYHFLLALFGAILCRFPSRKIFVIGITGTKGKSTVVELLSYVLEHAGHKTAFISSVHVKIRGELRKNMTGNTMPGRFFIQKFLREAVSQGCDVAIVEVTSQGVAQSRHRFIDFDAALFTNLEPEHIESHGSFEKYLDAKLEFFRATARSAKEKKYFFVNKDDEYASLFAKAASAGRTLFYSGEEYVLWQNKLDAPVHSANIAAVSTIAGIFGIKADDVLGILKKWKGVLGRMEVVQATPFRVVVDYAHTPQSLKFVYERLKNKKGKLICVLGAAGGGRDKWKRPKMGEIAAAYCDEIILTNEDPYDEDPEIIMNELAAGISGAKNKKASLHVHKVLDRKEALRKAVRLAKKDDTIVATGKGSESLLHLARGKTMPWNERTAIEEVLAEIKN